MENVERALQDIRLDVNKLLNTNETSQRSPMQSQPSPADKVTSHLLEASSTSEGYRGDSSFNAHVKRVKDTLKNAASDIGSISVSSLGDDDPRGDSTTAMDISGFEIPGSPDSSSSREDLQYPELENRTLPPINSVLLLLRLIQEEKQNFFLNMPVINENDFAEFCQQVYFAIRRYSLTTWAIVNVGLFYLFVGLKKQDYDRICVTASDIDSYLRLLEANIETTINSLRLCLIPSIEACQAMSFLVGSHFLYIKKNKNKTTLLTFADNVLHEGWSARHGMEIEFSRCENVHRLGISSSAGQIQGPRGIQETPDILAHLRRG